MTYDETTTLRVGQLDGTARLLAALGHPVRLKIVCGLLSGDCCVTPMVECLGLPQALVSRHLAILRSAGVVRVERDGRRRVYRLAEPRGLAGLVAALRGISEGAAR